MRSSEKRLALIGGGGFSKEIAEVARLSGYVVAAIYSSQPKAEVGNYRGYLEELLADRSEFDGVALAIGGVSRSVIKARADLILWLEANGLHCPPLISPRAILSEGVQVDDGAFVAHGVIINVAAVIGRFSVVNTGAIVGHDTTIGVNTTISPAAFIGGRCIIGNDSLVGPHAKVLQGVRVGNRAMIGMGCNVMQSLRDGTSVWPRPDRIIQDGI